MEIFPIQSIFIWTKSGMAVLVKIIVLVLETSFARRHIILSEI